MAQIKRIFCNTCQVETNHEIGSVHYRYFKDDADIKLLFFSETTEFDEALDFGDNLGVLKYETWICHGCDTTILQESCTIKYLARQKDNKITWNYDFCPPRANDSVYRKDSGLASVKLWFLYHQYYEQFYAAIAP